MLFFCNPGTSVCTTRPDPAWSLSRLTGQDTLQTTQRSLHTTRLRSAGCPPRGHALRPGHTPRCHSSNSSLYEPSTWKGGRHGALNGLSKGHGLLPSWQNTGFLWVPPVLKLCPALLHLGHSGTQLLESLIISSPSSVRLRWWNKGHDGSHRKLEAKSKLTSQHC